MTTDVPVYPTPQHEQAAMAIADFFAKRAEVEAVLLYGSTARGKATRDSCLDIMVLLEPAMWTAHRHGLAREWQNHYDTAPVFHALRQTGKYSHVDLDMINGQFVPGYHGWTSGPDAFELQIGNTLVYSAPLFVRGDYLADLKVRWLPYYHETLRRQRLDMVLKYCCNNLDHIPLFVERRLHFQAFHRLYNAYREFLQALFISRRVYPIAYDKWIREQVEEILGLPELYRRLPGLFQIRDFESRELVDKAEDLRQLVRQYAFP